METMTQRRIPAAGAPKPKTEAPNSVFAAGSAAAAKAGDAETPKARRTYKATPMIDVSKLVIREDVPLPSRGQNQSRSDAYRQVLLDIKPGQSFVVDRRNAKTFQEVARRAGIKVALRQDENDAEQVGVWKC